MQPNDSPGADVPFDEVDTAVKVDLTPYAGQYIAWSVDRRRVVVAAAELADFLDQLRQRDERGEPYLIGGWVPLVSLPIV